MEATAAAAAPGSELAPTDSDLGAAGGTGFTCRRNALPDVLDEAVTKMPASSAVHTLTRLHSIHGTYIAHYIRCGPLRATAVLVIRCVCRFVCHAPELYKNG